jgi:hypothetical protein
VTSLLLVLVGLYVCLDAGVALSEGTHDALDDLNGCVPHHAVFRRRADFHRDADHILSDSAPLHRRRELRFEASVRKLTRQHVSAPNRP